MDNFGEAPQIWKWKFSCAYKVTSRVKHLTDFPCKLDDITQSMLNLCPEIVEGKPILAGYALARLDCPVPFVKFFRAHRP